jgi:hypothetical protein
MYLRLSSQIGSQLRDAYAKRHDAGRENQATLAKKLGVGRSAINKRLTGQVNMTEKTIAETVWALGHGITVTIFDPEDALPTNFARMIPLDGAAHPDQDEETRTASTSAPVVSPRFKKLAPA